MEHNANRWDYIVGYRNQSYFVEVHPASTSEVGNIINKLNWLKQWLSINASHLNDIKAANPFHWVSTGRIGILPNSTYSRRLAIAGLGIPKSLLNLS